MSCQLSTEGFLKIFTFGPIIPHFDPKMTKIGHFWAKMGVIGPKVKIFKNTSVES